MANSTERSVTPTESKSETSPISIQGPYFEAIVGVVIAVVILVLLLLLAVILRYMYKHKGTYHTNEAKGTEFAETADAALRGDPALQDAMDESKKEYFIWDAIAGPLYTSYNKLPQAHMMPQSCLLEQWSNWLSSLQTETNKKSIVKFLYISISEIVYICLFLKKR